MAFEKRKDSFVADFTPVSTTSLEEYDQIESIPTLGETASLNFQRAWEDTAVGLLARKHALSNLENSGRKLTPDEANERYPNLPNPFRDEVSESAAQFLSDQAAERRELERRIAKGPDGLLAGTANFGAGLMAHMMDPIEMSASFVTGWGAGAALGRSAAGAKLLRKAQTSTKARVGLNTFEAGSGNLLENLAQETLIANQMLAEGRDPATLGEAALNTAVSTVAGTLVGVGVKEAANFTSRAMARIYKSSAPEAEVTVTNNIMSEMLSGRRPDPEPYIKALADETNITHKDFPQAGKFYSYAPLERTQVRNKEFLFVTRGRDINTAPVFTADDLGFGVTLTDSPFVANGSAVRSAFDQPGTIHSVRFDDLNFLDARQPIPSEMRKTISGAYTELGLSKTGLNQKPLRDALREIRDAVDNSVDKDELLQDVGRAFRDQGYDAILDDGTRRLNIDNHTPHNSITLLNEQKLRSQGSYEPDTSVIGKPDKLSIQQAADKKLNGPKDLDFSSELRSQVDKKLVELGNVDPRNIDISAKKMENDLKIQEIESLDKQRLLDEELKTAFEELKNLRADTETVSSAFDSLKTCVGA